MRTASIYCNGRIGHRPTPAGWLVVGPDMLLSKTVNRFTRRPGDHHRYNAWQDHLIAWRLTPYGHPLHWRRRSTRRRPQAHHRLRAVRRRSGAARNAEPRAEADPIRRRGSSGSMPRAPGQLRCGARDLAGGRAAHLQHADRPDPNSKVPDVPVLESGVVHIVGSPIAAVVAETRSQAEDAADLIEVEYEILPSISNAEEALRTRRWSTNTLGPTSRFA